MYAHSKFCVFSFNVLHDTWARGSGPRGSGLGAGGALRLAQAGAGAGLGWLGLRLGQPGSLAWAGLGCLEAQPQTYFLTERAPH